MSVELRKHNKEAYEKVQELFKEGRYAAVIHPTGTGKSYISMRTMEDYKDKNVMYVSSGKTILMQLDKDFKKNGINKRKDFNEFNRITYTKLINMSDEEIESLNLDLIVLDEFHHCGAEKWQQGVTKLLEKNSRAKVLGTSATPIRYSDNYRDMSDELFEGKIASEISLEEAISNDILPEVDYVTGIYEYEESLEEIIQNVENCTDENKKQSAMEEVEVLRKKLEQEVEQLPFTLEEYMKDKSGKYIVFCRNIQDMNGKIQSAKEMFGQVNENIDISSIHSEQSTYVNEQEIKRFENKLDDESLKLMFAVDMLNEGYHIKDLSGVVMLRPTVSPILYKQQLGRALSVGSQKVPVVIDLVNNVESCEIVERFANSVSEKQKQVRNINNNSQINNKFRVHGNVKKFKEIRDIIYNKIDLEVEKRKKLNIDEKIELAERYYIEEGKRIKFAAKYEGHNLGRYLSDIKVCYKKDSSYLTKEQIKRLEKIGLLEERKKLSIDEKIELAERCLAKTGEKIIGSTKYEGHNLGKYIESIKYSYKKDSTYLTNEQEERLEKIGALEIKHLSIDEKIELAEKCLAKTGEKIIQTTKYEGHNLGQYINKIKTSYKKDSTYLTNEQVKRLEKIGLLEERKILSIDEKIELAERCLAKTGEKIIGSTKYEGHNLGKYIESIKYSYKKDSTYLTNEQEERLEKIGALEIKHLSIDEKIELAEKCLAKTGEKIIQTTKYEGHNLGQYINKIKTSYKKDSTYLTNEQVKRLEKIGLLEERKILSIDEKIELAEKYLAKTGEKIIQTTKYEGHNLGKYINYIKVSYKKDSNYLTDEQAKKLEKIGILYNKKGLNKDKKTKEKQITDNNKR